MHPLPRMAQGLYQPIVASAYGISRDTKNPEVSWELQKQMVGIADQTDWHWLARFAPSLKALSPPVDTFTVPPLVQARNGSASH